MIEYLRDILSKSKPGDQYGKLLQTLSFNLFDPLLSIFEVWKVFIYRKLCSPVCRWFYIHRSCEFLHRVQFYHLHFVFFNSRSSNHNSHFHCNCLVLIQFICAGRWKCGIKTRCSVCFYRRFKDYISFISMWHLFVCPPCRFQRSWIHLGNLGVKLNSLLSFFFFFFFFTGNWFCRGYG